MRIMIFVVVLILSALIGAAQNQGQPAGKTSTVISAVNLPSQDVPPRSRVAKELSQVCGLWAKYFREKQLEKLVGLYAPQAVFLTGTGDRINGRAAIRSAFKAALENHESRLAPRSLVTEVSGNLAYDSGDYSETIIPASGGPGTASKGNYVIVFKRQRNGKWLIIEHVWTDAPAK